MLRLPALVALLAAVAGPGLAQTALRPGQTVQGELTTSDSTLGDGSYFDCFTIQTRPGQTLRIDQTSDAFDSYLQAGTGACGGTLTNLVSDDDSGGGLNARLEVQGDGGVLTVRANSLSTGMTGRYTLTVSEVGQGTVGGKPAAQAVPVPTAGTSGDPFDTPAVLVAKTEFSALFGLPVEYRPDGLRRMPVLQMFTIEQRSGPRAAGPEFVVDALLSDYIIDCSSGRYRIDSVTGYLRRGYVDSAPYDDPFQTPPESAVQFEAVKVACHPEQFDWQGGYSDYASKIARMRRVD
tara:strand:+ start:1766 stop:2644 length:879 start_codon:yes stop_codon:yes gene_type:complete